ncbi:MAG: hypothetical protein ACPHT7_00370 [Litorivicinaceae bacterium]
MRRKKKTKRGIIDEDIPAVSETEAKRQVIYGGIGFVVSCLLVVLFRPGTDHLLEMIILIGIVASSTFGGMRLASWLESKQRNLKG